MPHSIPVMTSIAPLAAETRAWLVDIWGVVHNGVTPYHEAGEACARFRDNGGTVLLLSNSPRPAAGVRKQLDQIGVRPDAYDSILSSGDATRQLIQAYAGRNLFHLGPERDRPLFDGSELSDVRIGEAENAEVIVCTGLFDDSTEGPDDYRDMLQRFADKGLPMICANPDVRVERGGRIIYCAGALAEAYAELGAPVALAGKPHKPIYDLAFDRIADLRGKSVPRSQVLAIGDGVHTDIAGALAAGVRAVYVASRVHMGDHDALSPEVLANLFPDTSSRPIAAMPTLAW